MFLKFPEMEDAAPVGEPSVLLWDHAAGRTPEISERQLHDECKTGGNQPANISVIYRRRSGPVPPWRENKTNDRDGPFEPPPTSHGRTHSRRLSGPGSLEIL